MLLRTGAGRRPFLSLFLAISLLLVISVALFQAFGPKKSSLKIVNSLPSDDSASSDEDHDIPPLPSACSEPSPALAIEPSQLPSAAPALSPKDLLCRPVDTNNDRIPKIFHQSWKSTELPSKFERWSETCRRMHPEWEWVLWTDDDNLKLVQTYFPWLEQTYLDLPGPIYRADFSRYLYMYMFGGYVSLRDFECVR